MTLDPCIPCGGTGAVRCSHCGGRGLNLHSALLNDPCRSCTGTGKEKCRACQGAGKCPGPDDPEPIDEQRIFV